MAVPQTAPCVNINDEVVQVVAINVKPSEFVKIGDVIGAVDPGAAQAKRHERTAALGWVAHGDVPARRKVTKLVVRRRQLQRRRALDVAAVAGWLGGRGPARRQQRQRQDRRPYATHGDEVPATRCPARCTSVRSRAAVDSTT